MQLLRSLLFALLFYPGTAIYVFAGLAGSMFGEYNKYVLRRLAVWVDL